MKNKRIKTLVLGLSLCIINLVPVVANAATTYETWSTRGVQYLAWAKNTLDWTVNSSLDIISMDAWQNHSGLFIRNDGFTKLSYSNVDNYYVNFRNLFLAGAVIGGQTIGYSQSYTDQVRANWSGNAYWTFGI